MNTKEHGQAGQPAGGRGLRLGIMAIAASLLGACSLPIEPAQPDAVRYFVLGAADAPTTMNAVPLTLAIKAVSVAEFLEPKGMVTLVGGREVKYAAAAFWAEPLRDAIAGRLRARLGAQATVLEAPTGFGAKRDFDLVVTVTQCGGTAEGGVRFSARFALQKPGGGALVQRTFDAPPAEWNGRDYGALADRLGQAANALAEAILAAAVEGK